MILGGEGESPLSQESVRNPVISLPQVSLFSGLDYWNGLLDWTTGLRHPNYHKMPFLRRQRLNMLIQPVTSLMLFLSWLKCLP